MKLELMVLKIIIYKKICKKNDRNNCKTIQDNTTLGQEIKLAILKKAATIADSEISKRSKKLLVNWSWQTTTSQPNTND